MFISSVSLWSLTPLFLVYFWTSQTPLSCSTLKTIRVLLHDYELLHRCTRINQRCFALILRQPVFYWLWTLTALFWYRVNTHCMLGVGPAEKRYPSSRNRIWPLRSDVNDINGRHCKWWPTSNIKNLLSHLSEFCKIPGREFY